MSELRESVGAPAWSIATAVRSGEVRAAEVVDAHVARLEALNPRLNAVVVPRWEQARADAHALDAARDAGEPQGPLAGVPMTIKEQFLLEGTPSTYGLPSRRGHRAQADGPLVAWLRAQGAVILGKTNVSQLLLGFEADNPVYGRSLNPWDAARTPGGSSGGEAAAVAAGLSALGYGADFGGSVRLPAAFCGVFGLKPTAWRLTNDDTDLSAFPLQTAVIPQPGPLARTAADLTLGLRVLVAGASRAADPMTPPAPWVEPPASVAGLRVAVFEDDGYFSPSPAIRRAVRRAAAVLEDAGATLVEAHPMRGDAVARLFLGLVGGDGMKKYRRVSRRDPWTPAARMLLLDGLLPGWLRPLMAGTMRLVGQRGLGDLLDIPLRGGGPAMFARNEALLAALRGFEDTLGAGADEAADVLLGPATGLPAFKHGTGHWVQNALGYNLHANLLGLPAGVAPVTRVRPGEESDRPGSGWDVTVRTARRVEAGSAGMPVGVQVTARRWREDLVLATLTAIEAGVREDEGYPVTPVTPASQEASTATRGHEEPA